jgi:hypothetical protein
MRNLKLQRPSPALVVSVIALSVALGGTGYAAIVLPANSVGKEQIKKNAVTAAKVKNRSLLAVDFKAGQLPAGPTGATGPKGEKGEKGEKGDPGTVDTSNFYSKGESDSRFLGAAAKAADADKLDGLDSTQLADAGQYDARDSFFSFTGARDCDDVFGQLIGPEVTVDVGPSGLVSVYAQAQIQDFGGTEGRVQLFEPNSLASCPTILRGNPASNGGIDVKKTLPGDDRGTTGLGAPVVFRVSPGVRTFTLRYGSTPDAGFSVNFSNRLLWVQPL